MLTHRHVAAIVLVGILAATTAATAVSNFQFGFGTTHKYAATGTLTQIIKQQGNGNQFSGNIGINSSGTQSITQTQSGGSSGTQIGANVSIGSSGGSQTIHATQSVH